MTLELTGVARLRAGRGSLVVEAASLGEALAALAARCPGVVPDVVSPAGELARHFVASIDGGPMRRAGSTSLDGAQRVVIVGAQAGG